MNKDTIDRVYYDILENPSLYINADLKGILDYWRSEVNDAPYASKIIELVSGMIAEELAKKRSQQLAKLGLV
jgi:hypothetical protein